MRTSWIKHQSSMVSQPYDDIKRPNYGLQLELAHNVFEISQSHMRAMPRT